MNQVVPILYFNIVFKASYLFKVVYVIYSQLSSMKSNYQTETWFGQVCQ